MVNLCAQDKAQILQNTFLHTPSRAEIYNIRMPLFADSAQTYCTSDIKQKQGAQNIFLLYLCDFSKDKTRVSQNHCANRNSLIVSLKVKRVQILKQNSVQFKFSFCLPLHAFQICIIYPFQSNPFGVSRLNLSHEEYLYMKILFSPLRLVTSKTSSASKVPPA